MRIIILLYYTVVKKQHDIEQKQLDLEILQQQELIDLFLTSHSINNVLCFHSQIGQIY